MDGVIVALEGIYYLNEKKFFERNLIQIRLYKGFWLSKMVLS